MHISLSLGCHGLPPAYDEFSELVESMMGERVSAPPEYPLSSFVKDLRSGSAKYEPQRRAYRIRESFAKAYTSEALEGRFEVLEAFSKISFTSQLADVLDLANLLTSGPTPVLAFGHMIKSARMTPDMLPEILRYFRAGLSPEGLVEILDLMDRLLETFMPPFETAYDKVFLPTVYGILKAGAATPPIVGRATRFLTSPRLIELLSHSKDTLIWNDPFADISPELFTERSAPFFVKIFNPSFFEDSCHARGIDVTVANLLVDACTEDFATFLDAAEALSAEKDSNALSVG